MRPSKLLKPTVLRTAGGAEEERSASWLELFFDLVFVVAIAQLALALGVATRHGRSHAGS